MVCVHGDGERGGAGRNTGVGGPGADGEDGSIPFRKADRGSLPLIGRSTRSADSGRSNIPAPQGVFPGSSQSAWDWRCEAGYLADVGNITTQVAFRVPIGETRPGVIGQEGDQEAEGDEDESD